MNTTAAALEAHVTADTIRTWCRIGAVAAVKAAGRWVIDTASLTRRIAIGARRARKQRRMSQPAEPVEVRFDEYTTIRAHQETSPAYGTTTWYACQRVNGWEKGIPFEGATAEEAINNTRRSLERAQAEAERQAATLGSLAAVGISVECVDTRAAGIHMATVTKTGECHYCGLNPGTCDCH